MATTFELLRELVIGNSPVYVAGLVLVWPGTERIEIVWETELLALARLDALLRSGGQPVAKCLRTPDGKRWLGCLPLTDYKDMAWIDRYCALLAERLQRDPPPESAA